MFFGVYSATTELSRKELPLTQLTQHSWNIRWPTTVTAKSFYSRQHQFCHGKINLATAKSISPRQNQFRHGKINLATAKSISQRQTQFRHGKSSFTTTKSILQYSKISFTHDKIIFTQGKIHFTTAKSFWRACSRDISSQSAMGSIQHGGVPRG